MPAFDDLCRTLVALDRPHGERRDAAHALHLLLARIAGPAFAAPTGTDGATCDTALPDGLALSPAYAAMCLLDHNRTGAFAAGLASAIARAQARFPGQRIRVLYAGTGPFATLALIQHALFSPEEVGFTLLDIHQSSLDAARRIHGALDLNAYLDAAHCADATTFAHEGPPFHVAVSETMQRALKKEPQVAITRRIARLLQPDGILVPERIALDLALFYLAHEYDPVAGWTGPGRRALLGTALDLTADPGLDEDPPGTLRTRNLPAARDAPRPPADPDPDHDGARHRPGRRTTAA